MKLSKKTLANKLFDKHVEDHRRKHLISILVYNIGLIKNYKKMRQPRSDSTN